MNNKKDVWGIAKIKNIEIKNRIVRSATNEFLGTLDGCITEDYIKVYNNLAKSGIGLLITSHMAVDKGQRAHVTHICVNDQRNIEKFRVLTSNVHKFGSKIIAQISYGGHKVGLISGQIAKSPSDTDTSVSMTEDDINKCINDYVKSVQVLENTGFDGVQLHLSHGYLLSEFLDPFYNKRTDDFGGNVKNRYNIIHKILAECKRVIANRDFLVIVKIDTTSKDANNNNFLQDQIQVCKWLENDGVDAIELSGNNYRNLKQDTPYFLDNALKIKKEVSVPLILVGGFRNINQIKDALEKGIDFISMSRPFITEENFIEKLKNNQESRCINCNKCFEIYRTLHKRCIFSDSVVHQLELNFPNK